MSTSEVQAIAPAVHAHAVIAQRAAPVIGLLECLVVAGGRQRQEMLATAAAERGWETIVCQDADSALRCLAQHSVRLALVDLEGGTRTRLAHLLEKLAASRGLLLIVCGNEDDAGEELWIRQLGAWLYLPGVVESSDLSALCGEARQIAEKLEPRLTRGASQPAQASSMPKV